MNEYTVEFQFPLSVEAESEQEAVKRAKSVLFDHLGQITLQNEDFEVINSE